MAKAQKKIATQPAALPCPASARRSLPATCNSGLAVADLTREGDVTVKGCTWPVGGHEISDFPHSAHPTCALFASQISTLNFTMQK
jgi:hypothetical protein